MIPSCTRTLLVLILLLAGSPVHAGPVPYGLLHVETHSDAFPVRDLIRGIGRQFRPGEQHVGFGRAESGVSFGRAHLGLLYRYEVFAHSSRSASELIWRSETDQDIPAGRYWPLRLAINQVAMHGVTAGYLFRPTASLTLSGNMQLLKATEMIDGHVNGAIATDAADYQGQARLQYFYTRDALWERPTNRRYGTGLALDMKLRWRPNARHEVSLELLDALNGIYWRQMYYTRAWLTTDRISYDSDGQLDVRAAMTGYEGNSSHWQRLPVKAYLRWHGDLAGRRLGAEVLWVDDYRDFRLRYYVTRWPGAYVAATAEGAVGLGYQRGSLALALQLDAAPKQARTFTLGIAWQPPGR